jgi:L-alanine-DL-glutamate epimerase-like enolase superfamily enzyme
MQITTLDTYSLSVPLPQPVRASTSTISRVSELIVRLTTDAGLMAVPDAPGLGLELRPDTLEKYGVKLG